ncbi:transmembrane protein [Ceratobasidium sp. AG-Ba]|nr:transmembrane protein [Ceratobasidium sp. AG-Ba]
MSSSSPANVTCPASPVPDFCNTIVTNPDISGIGVVASWLHENEKAFRDTSRNSFTISGGLIISSLITWKTRGLSLFDALIVSMLTTISTTFVSVNFPYIRTLGLSINVASLVFTAFWCYWGLQIWSSPSTFGLPPDIANCSANKDTKFVAFVTVSPLNPGLRGFALFIFAIGVIPALGSLRYSIVWLLRYWRTGSEIAKDNAAYRFAKEMRRKRKTHITRFGGLTGLIYMIVTTEVMIARNVSTKEALSKWSYGQFIAMAMLGQQILDSFLYLKQLVNEKHRRLAQHR